MLLALIFEGHPVVDNVLCVAVITMFIGAFFLNIFLFTFMILFPKNILRELSTVEYLGHGFSVFKLRTFPANLLAYVRMAAGCSGLKCYKKPFKNYPFEKRCSKTVLFLGKAVIFTLFFISVPSIGSIIILGIGRDFGWW